MRRTLLSLCAALAVLSVAVGGAYAAGPMDTTTPSTDDDDGGDVGICMVGADSPCNGPAAENGTTDATHPTPVNDSTADDGNDSDEQPQILLPEDQNRDGEIDDRFRGNDSKTEAGICVVGADSPCNGPEHTDNQSGSEDGERIGSDDDEEGQLWIPEDQNRDGEIDDRFRNDSVAAVVYTTLSVFGLR